MSVAVNRTEYLKWGYASREDYLEAALRSIFEGDHQAREARKVARIALFGPAQDENRIEDARQLELPG